MSNPTASGFWSHAMAVRECHKILAATTYCTPQIVPLAHTRSWPANAKQHTSPPCRLHTICMRCIGAVLCCAACNTQPGQGHTCTGQCSCFTLPASLPNQQRASHMLAPTSATHRLFVNVQQPMQRLHLPLRGVVRVALGTVHQRLQRLLGACLHADPQKCAVMWAGAMQLRGAACRWVLLCRSASSEGT